VNIRARAQGDRSFDSRGRARERIYSLVNVNSEIHRGGFVAAAAAANASAACETCHCRDNAYHGSRASEGYGLPDPTVAHNNIRATTPPGVVAASSYTREMRSPPMPGLISIFPNVIKLSPKVTRASERASERASLPWPLVVGIVASAFHVHAGKRGKSRPRPYRPGNFRKTFQLARANPEMENSGRRAPRQPAPPVPPSLPPPRDTRD